ncbi:MAG: BspA family leucine-rich repeat surface protein, partial [Erysipelotrichaceae bacterium]|nr:BspA family leucine-rich repeat surface protein [Erysipelotrichaceae bacterium]
MNKIIKRLALGIISALMCLGCIELSKVKAEDNYLSQFSYQTVQAYNMIILTSHEGNSESVSIYSPVEIDGNEYTVSIADNVLSNNDVIKNLTINGNVMFPENLAGFFASSSYESVILDVDDTTAVTSMKDMFKNCNDLISVSFLKFNTSNVTDMSGMFDGCTSLEKLDLSSFNTERVLEMDNMFGNCCDLTEVILGDQFTVWTNEAYLSDGLWVNGDNCLNEVSLYEQYSSHAETWAGTWQRRDNTEITEIILSKDEDELYVGDEEQISLAADTEEPVKTVSEETALMSTIDTNSSDVNSESSQTVRALPDTGVAYAILQANGELVFFRSENTYSNGVDYTVTDINGNNYTGTVYAGVEDAVMDVPPWSSNADSITRVLVAEGTIIKPKSMAEWFAEAMNLESFNGSGFDTSDITDMSDMFGYCTSLTALNLSSINTGNVIDMSGMFNSCKNLTTLDLSSFDTSSVTDMSMMFDGCNSLTSINLSSFDTSNVADMSLMFDDCSSLTSIDLSGFDTSNVTDMSDMFCYCSSLTSLDLGSFDTS